MEDGGLDAEKEVVRSLVVRQTRLEQCGCTHGSNDDSRDAVGSEAHVSRDAPLVAWQLLITRRSHAVLGESDGTPTTSDRKTQRRLTGSGQYQAFYNHFGCCI